MRRSVTSAHLAQPAFVCRSCLAQQLRSHSRAVSVSAARRSHASQPVRSGQSASGIAALSSRRLISVSGPDAAKYLQGVVTANLVPAPTASATEPTSAGSHGLYTAFLNAQGRVLHEVFIYRNDVGIGVGRDGQSSAADSFLIEVDAAEAERLAKHIKRYKLRAKFAVRLLDRDEATVWHAWNDEHTRPIDGTDGRQSKAGDSSILLQDPRAPNLGVRAISPGGQTAPPPPLQELLLLDTAAQQPEQAYHIRRYLHGVAEGQDELVREHALPLESNLDVVDGAIDFRKGCYVGQELTIRTRHRGVVRKRVLPCVLYGEAQPVPEVLAFRPAVSGNDGDGSSGAAEAFDAAMVPRDTSIGRVGKRGRSAGKWLKGVGNIGLALCRLEIMTDLAVPGEAQAVGTAFSPEDEFVLQDKSSEGEEQLGQAVRVKAFVPDWLRRALDVSQHAQ